MSLKVYRKKRNFAITPEPGTKGSMKRGAKRRFVIQKHAASRLHYDFRLELGGTLVSWAVPKGLPMAHGEKHLAVKVENHPLAYFDFEGTIPKGQYGGGTVQVWDVGTFEPLSNHPLKELEGGKLHVVLKGKKLQGEWYLVRLREENQWLIIRGGEDHGKLSRKAEGASAISGRTLPEIAKSKRVWRSGGRGDEGRGSQGGGRKKGQKAEDKKEASRRDQHLGVDEMPFIEPMMAKLVDEAPPGEWSYEIKFDGFRALGCIKERSTGLLSRTRHDLTAKFPEVAEALHSISARKAVLDGEIVALDGKGRSSFQLLQAYELGQERPPLYYYVFDLLELNGKSLRGLPLEERKRKLKELLPEEEGLIRYSASLGDDSTKLMKMAARHGLEGLIGKRTGSVYEPGKRSGTWIKLKLQQEQEFVIGGYTDPSGARSHLGALLVGVYSKGRLTYAGKVGTGFNTGLLKELHARLGRIARKTCPFADLPEERTGRYGQGITAAVMKKCHWIKPELVAQIKFAEWTRDGRLRQPVFLGLREDKEARSVIRETPA